MTGDWNFLIWLLILSIPPGLALAAYWARGLQARQATQGAAGRTRKPDLNAP